MMSHATHDESSVSTSCGGAAWSCGCGVTKFMEPLLLPFPCTRTRRRIFNAANSCCYARFRHCFLCAICSSCDRLQICCDQAQWAGVWHIAHRKILPQLLCLRAAPSMPRGIFLSPPPCQAFMLAALAEHSQQPHALLKAGVKTPLHPPPLRTPRDCPSCCKRCVQRSAGSGLSQ
jgi:hypothetical protein